MVDATLPLARGKSLEEKIKRFDVHQIIQHAGLMVSFILLAVTGLPMKFNTLAASQWWIGVWGGIEVTRSAHRFGAAMMFIVCLYHIIYLLYTLLILKKPFPVAMVPTVQDVIQLYHEMAYYMGLKKERPKVGRFNWREKFDYWAIFWGMPVMFLSGIVLMFPVWATNHLPGWIVPASLVAHGDEAILAVVWIALMHIFFNHFTPGVFPLNTSIFTGKVTRQRYQREHALEYERLTRNAPADSEGQEDVSPAKEKQSTANHSEAIPDIKTT